METTSPFVFDRENHEMRSVWVAFAQMGRHIVDIEWARDVAIGARVRARQKLGEIVFQSGRQAFFAPTGCAGIVRAINGELDPSLFASPPSQVLLVVEPTRWLVDSGLAALFKGLSLLVGGAARSRARRPKRRSPAAGAEADARPRAGRAKRQRAPETTAGAGRRKATPKKVSSKTAGAGAESKAGRPKRKRSSERGKSKRAT